MMTQQKLESQIKSLMEYDGSLTPGSGVKGIMKTAGASSADLWQVPINSPLIYVQPGLNPRVHDESYQEGIKELAEDMLANGFYRDKPLVGFIANIDGQDRIVLGDGHRRYEAVQLAKQMGSLLESIPFVIRDKSQMSMEDVVKSMLHSNEGKPFTVFEKAIIAKRFKSYGWDDTRIAKEMRVTPAFVGQLHTLAGSPQEIQRLVKEGVVSATYAIETVKKHGDKAEEVLSQAVEKAVKRGKTKVTAKDTLDGARQRRAKTAGPRFYSAVVLLLADKKVTDVIDRQVYEELDALCTEVENGKARKALAAPKAEKKGAPLAKKVARASKKAESRKKPAPWDVQKEQHAAAKGQ